MKKALRSTRVLTPAGLAAASVLVEEDRIAAVCGWNETTADTERIEFGDAVLLPGLIDTHVHINEPGRTEWEGFETATRAAAAGGVTMLVDMPLNCVPETIDVSALEEKRQAALGKTWVDWAAWGGVVRGNAPSIEPLVRAGVPGFKCFLIHSGIDGFAWVDETDLRLALGKLRGTGLPLLAHAELAGPVDAATYELNQAGADWHKYSTFLASRPDFAEVEAIAQLIRLAEEFQTPIHIVHLSSAKALPLLAAARDRGVPVTVETCAHYLWFESEEIPDDAMEYKCAPPIRDAANREALWRALKEGLIEMIVTDHSPCPPAMKHSGKTGEGRWDRAWGGIASLGLALPVVWTAMQQRDLEPCRSPNIEQIGQWMAAAPARLAGLAGRKGTITVGADADFAIFDPEATWTVTPDDLHFRHKISPYLGSKLQGRVLETWLRGQRVYQDGRGDKFVGTPRGREQVPS
ncbi:MAG TPA: allantoinase AllB [Terracidiphilus sp.]|jgi:allantoinase